MRPELAAPPPQHTAAPPAATSGQQQQQQQQQQRPAQRRHVRAGSGAHTPPGGGASPRSSPGTSPFKAAPGTGADHSLSAGQLAERAAALLQQQGRLAEAEALLHSALRRCPPSDTAVRLALLRWLGVAGCAPGAPAWPAPRVAGSLACPAPGCKGLLYLAAARPSCHAHSRAAPPPLRRSCALPQLAARIIDLALEAERERLETPTHSRSPSGEAAAGAAGAVLEGGAAAGAAGAESLLRQGVAALGRGEQRQAAELLRGAAAACPADPDLRELRRRIELHQVLARVKRQL